MRVSVIIVLILLAARTVWPCSGNARPNGQGMVMGYNENGGAYPYHPPWMNNKAGVLKQNRSSVEIYNNLDDPTNTRRNWVSAYSSMTVSFLVRDFISSGINEAGLILTTTDDGPQGLAPSICLNEDNTPCPEISPFLFAQYLLDTCDSISCVEEAADDYRVDSGAFFLAVDENQEAILLEYLDGETIIHRTDDPQRILSHIVNANFSYANDFYQDPGHPDGGWPEDRMSLCTELLRHHPYCDACSSPTAMDGRRDVRAAYLHDHKDPAYTDAEWTWAVTHHIKATRNCIRALYDTGNDPPYVAWVVEQYLPDTFHFFYPHASFPSSCSEPVQVLDAARGCLPGEAGCAEFDLTGLFEDYSPGFNLDVAERFIWDYAGWDPADPDDAALAEAAIAGLSGYASTYTSDGCSTCGDDRIDGSVEECDGTDLGGQDCQDFGFEAGVLACTAACNFDTTDCRDCDGSCGDGCCEAGETTCSCPDDCGVSCGDGCCGESESNCDCPEDCGAVCGDGCCADDESTCNCPGDCGVVCGDGCCPAEESADECPADCARPSGGCASAPRSAAAGWAYLALLVLLRRRRSAATEFQESGR